MALMVAACNPKKGSGAGDEGSDDSSGAGGGDGGGDGTSKPPDAAGGTNAGTTQPGGNLPASGADPKLFTGPQTRLIGRTYTREDKNIGLAFPGTGAQVSFIGNKITIGMSAAWPGQYNGVDIYLDNNFSQTLYLRPANGSSNRYDLEVSGAADRLHTLTIVKRNEVSYGTILLQGFETTGTLNPNTLARPSRLIEFIGDNVAVGYGVDGPLASPKAASCSGSGQWPTNPAFANANGAYPVLVAKALNADWSIVGASGRGIATNYSGAKGNTLPALWRLADPQNIVGGKYDFSSAAAPDVVVLHGGASDALYATAAAGRTLDQGEFAGRYASFLADIRKAYPKAAIVATIGPNLSGQALNIARQAVQAGVAAANDSRVTFFEIAANGSDVTCDYHPDRNGHQKIASQLVQAVGKVAGWGG